MRYSYQYSVYDVLRQQAGDMWRGALDSGRHDGPTMQVRDAGKTLQLKLVQNPISTNLYINQVPQQDVVRVMREAFCELTAEEAARYVRDWDFIKIEELGIGRLNFSDLATEWRQAPQRKVDRAAARAIKSKQRRQCWMNATTRLRTNVWVTIAIWAAFLAAVAWACHAVWGQNPYWVMLWGAIASILALFLMLYLTSRARP